MISILDLLKYRLDQSSASRRPVGFPEALQGFPEAYGEGQIMAPRPWYNPGVEIENMLPMDSPQRRENRLNDKIGFGNFMRQEGMYAVPEGGWLSLGDRGFADPFPSPLNQMLRRGPFALY